ncbi:MAG: hypothetical protein J3K34DRAFT_86067 [Monoraphidium minutum]|nr:MAG: hypothetical protein J3K34DRAFT_86067 [Monoraphidium minutum]
MTEPTAAPACRRAVYIRPRPPCRQAAACVHGTAAAASAAAHRRLSLLFRCRCVTLSKPPASQQPSQKGCSYFAHACAPRATARPLPWRCLCPIICAPPVFAPQQFLIARHPAAHPPLARPALQGRAAWAPALRPADAIPTPGRQPPRADPPPRPSFCPSSRPLLNDGVTTNPVQRGPKQAGGR